MILRYFFVLISSLLLLSSCQGPKSLMKEAKVFEEAGLKEKAFESYELIYDNYRKAEALVGMKRIAQKNLDEKFQKAQQTCAFGQHEAALKEYAEAFDYANRYRSLELKVPASAEMQKESCRQSYINLLIDEATAAIKDERYSYAQELIQKLGYLDRNNKKVEYLDILSRIFPNYRSGQKALELGLYRQGYEFFNEVTKLDAGFEDALALRDLCLEKSRFTMAYVPVHNKQAEKAIERSVSATIKQKILQLKSPFIALVEREALDQMIQEQMNNMSAVFDQSTVIEAGKLAGARYIITGELISYEPMNSPQRNIERKGFLGSTEAAKKIKYVEHRVGRGLDASFRYQILDAETGKIFASEIITFSERDQVIWAEYEGDYESIYPGEWKWQLMSSKDDYINKEGREELMKQFAGRKSPMTEMEFRMKMMESISNKVADAVKNFNP